MRRLLTVIIVGALLWGVYWYIGARAVEGGLTAWLEQRRDEGWVAEYSDLSTRGFPNRFDTTITNLDLADMRTGVAWQAPFFQILALSYRPNHIIAVWPDAQILASPHEKLTITNSKMIASVVFEPGTSLTLERSNFDLKDFGLQSSLGWSANIESGEFYTAQTVGKTNSHDMWFEAEKMYPSEGVLRRLDPAKLLPDLFETFRIDTTAEFDAPWDRFSIERRRPQITFLDLKELQANWGNLDLWAAGELAVDSQGIPDGKITIRAKNWRDMLRIGIDTGVVPANISKTLEQALEILAGMSGNPNTLDAPLTFRNGRVSFGPIPLGPAPRLVIR